MNSKKKQQQDTDFRNIAINTKVSSNNLTIMKCLIFDVALWCLFQSVNRRTKFNLKKAKIRVISGWTESKCFCLSIVHHRLNVACIGSSCVVLAKRVRVCVCVEWVTANEKRALTNILVRRVLVFRLHHTSTYFPSSIVQFFFKFFLRIFAGYRTYRLLDFIDIDLQFENDLIFSLSLFLCTTLNQSFQ